MTGTHRTLIDSNDLTARPQPTVILSNPQMGENIGAAARAMLNCGLAHMLLVNPRDGWPNERAQAMSSGALELMPPVEVFDTLPAATSDHHYIYATTARPRDLVKPVFTPRAAAADMRERIAAGQKVAILFGAERAGLSNDEVAQANAIITIPLNPGFSSLNLGQSVLLVAYEWSQMLFEAPEKDLPTGKSRPATAEEFENFFTRLENELSNRGFFRVDEMKETIARNIRSLFVRAEATDQEIKTLHGIISVLTGSKENR
jgi:tRNA/rRNA methyltransferase